MKQIQNLIKLSGLDQRSWLNPLFIAVLPAVIIIWLQPVKFSPLLFELYESVDNTTFWYLDLEDDGNSERFSYSNEITEGHANLQYFNDKKQLLGQYNLENPIAKSRVIPKPYDADFNKDGVKDLVIFTQNKDSLFLDAFNYKTESGLLVKRFITTIGGLNDHQDFTINTIGHYDVNSDSVPEFYFSVAAGFALYPRRIYRYDFANDSLISSLNTGAGHLDGAILQNNDSTMIGIGSLAYGNIGPEYPYPYHDSTTWFFCFDKNLKLKFPPKNYGTDPAGLEFPIAENGFVYYLVASNNASPVNRLLKMNWQGAVVDSIVFDFYVSKRFIPVYYKDKLNYYIYNENSGDYLYFDIEKFEVYKSYRFHILNRSLVIYNKDLNNNGYRSLITFNRLTKRLAIYDHKFNIQNEIVNDLYVRTISANYYNELGFGELAINADSQSRIYRYYNNPLHFFKYLFVFGIYIVSVLFVSFVLFFHNKRIRNHQIMEQKLADLQLQNLRNQLDPHFTFNVLNSVGNAIYNYDKEEAYNLFQRFARIIRSSLMVSDKVFRSLKEEIQFTQDYLEFQKLRFENRFDFRIKIDKGISAKKIQFPKMIIQGFAENTVKHAFNGIDRNGLITLKVQKENNVFKVIIEDNGIGINQSRKQKITSGTQKGLEILLEQIRQINKLYHTNYSITIEDKSESDSELSGTKVVISFTESD